VRLSSGGASVTRYSGTSCSGVGPEPWNTSSASGDAQAPTAPSGLGATAVSSTRVDLAWTAATDNSGVTGYRIYRDGAMVGTVGAVTAYPDTTVRAGTTYDYQVRAVDAAGNESGPSETRSVRTPVTVRFTAAADARVEQANPASSHGTSPTLRTDGGADPDVETYLRFEVSGVTGPIASAKLRLRTGSDTADGPAVYRTDWTGLETTITWNNRPARTSAATDDKARIGSSTWIEYDVKPLVAGDGVHSFVLATGSSDGIDFRSREYSDVTRRPELVLTY
jgi:chitodextrinase